MYQQLDRVRGGFGLCPGEKTHCKFERSKWFNYIFGMFVFFCSFFLGRHNALKAEDRSISEEMISNSLNHAVDKGRPWNEDTDLIGKIGPPKMTFWRLQNVVPFRRFSLGRHSEDSRHLQVYKYKLWYLTLKDSHFRVVKHAVVFGKHQDRTPKRQKRQRIMRDRRLVPMPSADGVRDRKAHGGPKTGLDPGCREHAMIWVLEQAAPNSPWLKKRKHFNHVLHHLISQPTYMYRYPVSFSLEWSSVTSAQTQNDSLKANQHKKCCWMKSCQSWSWWQKVAKCWEII